MAEELFIGYEVRFTATVFVRNSDGSDQPFTRQYSRNFIERDEANEYISELTQAMNLPRSDDPGIQGGETQSVWIRFHLGKEGWLDSFDGLWEIRKIYNRLDHPPP